MALRLEETKIRFAFGRNWTQFLRHLTDERILSAEQSLAQFIGDKELIGKRYLDIGCGSGLFSLAAKRLGADVVSMDYDSDSVLCAEELKNRYYPNDANWVIYQKSILNDDFVNNHRNYDIVYAWGILHHTGDMKTAINNTMATVANRGSLVLSIYNDQGWLSRYWLAVKKLYHKNVFLRWLVIGVHFPYHVLARYLVRKISGRENLERGMSYWYDMLDWLGGLPFEVARPELIIDMIQAHEFVLKKLKTCGGRSGCNEFLFVREQ